MKKQVLLLTLLLLFVSVVSMAQSTYLNPYPGFSHTYSATVSDAGGVNPVRWYVATDVNGATKATHGTDYTFVTSGFSAANNQLEGTAVYSVNLTWGATVTAASNYYVFIEVDDKTSGCTNRMALAVQVAADFNARVFDMTTASNPATDPSGDPSVKVESCPDDIVNPVWNGSGHTDIGTSELIFRVERQFSALAWQFEYALSEGTSQAFGLTNLRIVNKSGTQLYSGTALTGSVLSIGSAEDYVLVYAKITNQQGKTLDVDFNLINTNSLTKDSGGSLDSNVADNSADHTILPMPVISNFSGN
ncbi:MAG: hypothetical protein ACERKD_02240 [Prolixibacteraceae bacterium]